MISLQRSTKGNYTLAWGFQTGVQGPPKGVSRKESQGGEGKFKRKKKNVFLRLSKLNGMISM